MKYARMAFFLSSLLTLIALLIACTPNTPTPIIAPTCTPCSMVASPNVNTQWNNLVSVSALASDNAWSVGFYFDANQDQLALIEHWDGTQWSIVASPRHGLGDYSLQGVAAIAPTDVWAVGSYNTAGTNGDSTDEPLIEHWNGTQWSVVASPKTFQGELNSVTAIAANDVWAVGDYVNSNGLTQPLTEHWNGTRWNMVPGGTIGNHIGKLQGVTALASNDVWVVGTFTSDPNPNVSISRGLIEHWNGSRWSIMLAPTVGQQNYLTAIAAISASNIYAVGRYNATLSGTNDLPLLEQWNGSRWIVVSGTTPRDSFISQLNGIAAVAPNNIWAVGTIQSNTDAIKRPLVEQWNGKQWRIFSSPGRGPDSHLNAIAPIRGTSQLWSVGGAGGTDHNQTLTERFG